MEAMRSDESWLASLGLLLVDVRVRYIVLVNFFIFFYLLSMLQIFVDRFNLFCRCLGDSSDQCQAKRQRENGDTGRA